jgi:hypothetical protein
MRKDGEEVGVDVVVRSRESSQVGFGNEGIRFGGGLMMEVVVESSRHYFWREEETGREGGGCCLVEKGGE